MAPRYLYIYTYTHTFRQGRDGPRGPPGHTPGAKLVARLGKPTGLPLRPISLDVQQQTGRIFQQLLDGDQEAHRLAAVDDAVIVGER